MPDDPFFPLASESDWSDALSQSAEGPVLLFKYSAACPISGKADRQMRQLAEDEDLPVYRLVVQDSRNVSDTIAESLDVQHETPQVILLHEEEVVFEASHFDVTPEAVREALGHVPASP